MTLIRPQEFLVELLSHFFTGTQNFGGYTFKDGLNMGSFANRWLVTDQDRLSTHNTESLPATCLMLRHDRHNVYQ